MAMIWSLFILLFGFGRGEETLLSSPEHAVLVFNKGEGGYFCHKIPYLFHTQANTLIALGPLPHSSLLISSLTHSGGTR
jgi:hypothetical protein